MFTLATPDAFSVIDVLTDRNNHGTNFLALATVNAGTLIQLHLVQSYLIKEGVNCPQRTKVAAEETGNRHRPNHRQNQQEDLPIKEKACALAQSGNKQQLGYTSLKGSGRTDVFAKIGNRPAVLRQKKEGEDNDHHP